MKHAFAAPTALAELKTIPCPNRYDLLGPVRTLRKDLGLTTNDLAVLTALISFLPRERHGNLDSEQLALTVVFPSNASLSERANGLDERTLRRCLGRLATAELIERKSSANGKRFPLRYGGVIRDAFGIDLKPLMQQYATLSLRASQLTEKHARLRSLKAEALALRASVLQQTSLDDTKISTLSAIRNILRRATLTVETVLGIISELRKFGADVRASYGEQHADAPDKNRNELQDVDLCFHSTKSTDLSATNGQNVRHIESIKKDFKRTRALNGSAAGHRPPSRPSMNRNYATMSWEDFSHVAGFFPEPPRNGEALTRTIYELGSLLRISHELLRRGFQEACAGKLLLIFDYLISRADVIERPNAYFEKMLRT
ncbi:replication protein C [Paracoccus liaowanqingii]|uniref:Replication protein C n=1 Tax=Paracoccus liaowanqingii TaxID=2560053 RepID=A0A4Z1CS36_9RHOB|nr:helix-turn-helix domain-containing protein [Paracoccus liaowanqingii]TGN67988.1 replication protein C [Paracoccus liaowanqingii]